MLKLVAVRKHEIATDEILAFARARLSSRKVPSIVEFRDALPRSSSGKLLRAQVG
jgi:acyl-CoA synthetase (AMP-forming)/AMP-acid ligase II